MRSLLFIPADSPSKLAKGFGTGADALVLDLEDSISAENKEAARQGALTFLKEAARNPQRPLIYIRINGFETGLTDADLDVIVAGKPDGVMFPKADGGASLIHLDAKLTAREAMHGVPEGSVGIIAMATETAKALFNAGTFGGATPRLKGITWGAEDLAAELGSKANRDTDGQWLDPFRLARTLCIAGAAAAQVQAIDTIYPDYRNEDGLRRECEAARRDGFSGKMAIHPAQVKVINDVFTPSADELVYAQRVVDAFASAPGGGVVGLDGKMLDHPHLAKAKALLARK